VPASDTTMALSKASRRPRKASVDSDSDHRHRPPPRRRHSPPRRHLTAVADAIAAAEATASALACFALASASGAGLPRSTSCCAKKVGTPVCPLHLLLSSWAILAAALCAAARPSQGSWTAYSRRSCLRAEAPMQMNKPYAPT